MISPPNAGWHTKPQPGLPHPTVTLAFCRHLRAWSRRREIPKGACGGQALTKEIWSPDCWKTLYSHSLQIHTVRNQSIYRCMSWMQFLFLLTVKKRYCWNIYMPCVFINIIFITKMYSRLLLAMGKFSLIQKNWKCTALKGIMYMIFLKNCFIYYF